MEWLLENKFPYDCNTFAHAVYYRNRETVKWLFKNGFPYSQANELTIMRMVNSND